MEMKAAWVGFSIENRETRLLYVYQNFQLFDFTIFSMYCVKHGLIVLEGMVWRMFFQTA
ncbi:hypothetical protein [Neisseria montereyensis]|uniref:Uncharacterized protein n=1 Tax=Neisseria montereyensis TaxID=2973938 RepID=A0ABT2FBI6_9NEIS|nr:hypothetical protein [Neisseria montereyensis]MCS4533578.1 hypothetical protein [Neisseria montereyensis]